MKLWIKQWKTEKMYNIGHTITSSPNVGPGASHHSLKNMTTSRRNSIQQIRSRKFRPKDVGLSNKPSGYNKIKGLSKKKVLDGNKIIKDKIRKANKI